MTIYAQATSNQYTIDIWTLWEKLLPRLDLSRNSVDFLSCCQDIIDIIVDHLWFRQSELIRVNEVFQIEADTESIDLPANLVAIATNPYIYNIGENIKSTILYNIEDTKRYSKLQTTDKAKPTHYDLRSNLLYLYPTSDAEYTLRLEYYQKPEPLTSFDSILPFNGIFNQLIGDNAVKISNVGLSLLSDQTFVVSILEKVDKVINLRTKKDTYFFSVPNSNQYGYYRSRDTF